MKVTCYKQGDSSQAPVDPMASPKGTKLVVVVNGNKISYVTGQGMAADNAFMDAVSKLRK